MSSNNQRDRVLALVRAHSGPVDAQELARSTGLHVTTVRFHLDGLCDAGVLRRTRVARGSVGRPRTGYELVEHPADYRMLAGVLASGLGDSAATRSRRARRAGQAWAAELGDTASAGEPQDRLAAVAAAATKVFTDMGFAPEEASGTRRSRRIQLHACPLRALARSAPEVVCAVHQGVLDGLVSRTGSAGDGDIDARIEPFIEPELCAARLTLRQTVTEPSGRQPDEPRPQHRKSASA